MSYTVPRMWEGETVAVIATGPSLTREQCESVRDLPAIAVNDAWRLAPWAQVRYAADTKWWRANPEAVSQDVLCLGAQPNRPDGVEYIRTSGTHGFDPNPCYVRTGGNSGYQAIHVAIHAGAARILMLGFDMHGTHFFGPHKPPLTNTGDATMSKWAGRFRGLKNRGAEIINCTPGSRIAAFSVAELDDVLQEIFVR